MLDPLRHADSGLYARLCDFAGRVADGKVGDYEVARFILTHPEDFTSTWGTGPGPLPARAEFVSLNLSDPPAHGALRRKVGAWLAERWHACREEVARQAAHLIERAGPDALTDIARALPRRVLQAVLDIPAAAEPAIFACVEKIASHQDWEPSEKRLLELLLENPMGPMTGLDGAYLVRLLILAGWASTSAAIANLLIHMAEFDCVRAEEFLEESLRLASPISQFSRQATRPLRVGDEELEQGDRVTVLFPAVNRDPEHFPEPSEFRPGRKCPHLSFGAGPHQCLGAEIARTLLLWVVRGVQRRGGLRIERQAPPASAFTLGPSVLRVSWNS